MAVLRSSRPGGQGGPDIWVSYREQIHDDLGWQAPVNLGPAVNSSNAENNATYVQNDEGGAPLRRDRRERPMTSLTGKRGTLVPQAPVTDGTFIYFSWRDDRSDVWVMDLSDR